MKKNNMMRIASVLLVAVLLTSCVIAGTFAKYVSTAGGEDQARVAYWGFGEDSEIVLTNLFKDAYIDDEVRANDALDKGSFDGSAETVIADIIAPGTTNNVDFKFAYNNYEKLEITAPEVAYTFTISTEGSVCADDIANNENIIWYLDDVACDNFADLLADIKALSGDASGSKIYAPNQAPAEFADGETHNIKWEWVFEDTTHADVNSDGIDDQDAIDTAMGNKDLLDAVKIVINITATQIDTYDAP